MLRYLTHLYETKRCDPPETWTRIPPESRNYSLKYVLSTSN